MSEGAFLDVVADFNNDLTSEWPGSNISPPISVVQCCLKSGSGTVKSVFLDLALRLNTNWKPNDGEWWMYPLWHAPLWSIVTLESWWKKWGMPSKATTLLVDKEGETSP